MAATINLKAFPFSQSFDCPHCHLPITLYDPAGSEFVVCKNCNSYNRFIATGHLQVQQPVSPIKNTPVIPIGKEGTLKDIPYKVIGYMEKKEAATEYEWREYMLYNYTKGYAFLAEYDGHWNFIAGKDHYPEVANAVEVDFTATMDGVDYALYNRYAPVITALTGEYDWDVYEERVLTREFINPPYLLVEEQNKKNERIIDWYLGEYIEPEEIAEGFNIPVDKFQETVDIGENQPNPYKERWLQSLRISVVAAVLLIGLQLSLVVLKPNNLIMNKSVELSLPPAPPIDTTKHGTSSNSFSSSSYSTSNNGNFEFKSLRTSAFNIANGPAPLEIDLSSPVDNNWFETTVELVSERDNQTWDVSKQMEYYHGYEDGESWSEGSTSASVLLNNIPQGYYHLNIYPYGGSRFIDHMNIKVAANVILWQNILITLLLLCLYPLYCWYIARQFEVNRWMGNYYSPYKKATSND